MDTKKTKVCVIGAGAAGLCAARHLAENVNEFEFSVFEKTSDIGGTWVYTDKIGLDDDGLSIHSSMYKNLRTNLPKEIMSFPDFREMKGGNDSCVTHEIILDYLKDYAEHYHLYKYIKFNTSVESVKLIESDPEKWKVKIKKIKTNETQELFYDAVMVCSGHYFDPYIPEIPGLKNFQGQIIHSHDYRKPEAFTGKSIIVLGASSSGVDIAFELSQTASHVYLSHNNERLTPANLSLGISEVQGIEKFENDNKFLLNDGSSIRADVLIFCTGYHFVYPFLDTNCGIHVDENHVQPLYKHLINIEHTSMCLIGIPLVIVPFPMFHIQVQFFLSTLRDNNRLPEKSVMLEDSKLQPGIKKRHAHKLGMTQWLYNDELTRMGGFKPLPKYYKLGYAIWSKHRKTNLKNYKKNNLIIADDGKSVILKIN